MDLASYVFLIGTLVILTVDDCKAEKVGTKKRKADGGGSEPAVDEKEASPSPPGDQINEAGSVPRSVVAAEKKTGILKRVRLKLHGPRRAPWSYTHGHLSRDRSEQVKPFFFFHSCFIVSADVLFIYSFSTQLL